MLVDVCVSGQPCSSKAADPGTLVMNLTTAITDADAKAIFSPLSSIKILRFSSMLDVFAGFADDADKDRFYRRVKDYAGIWCCIQAHPVRALVHCGSRTARPALTAAAHRATSGTTCCLTKCTSTAITGSSTGRSRCSPGREHGDALVRIRGVMHVRERARAARKIRSRSSSSPPASPVAGGSREVVAFQLVLWRPHATQRAHIVRRRPTVPTAHVPASPPTRGFCSPVAHDALRSSGGSDWRARRRGLCNCEGKATEQRTESSTTQGVPRRAPGNASWPPRSVDASRAVASAPGIAVRCWQHSSTGPKQPRTSAEPLQLASWYIGVLVSLTAKPGEFRWHNRLLTLHDYSRLLRVLCLEGLQASVV